MAIFPTDTNADDPSNGLQRTAEQADRTTVKILEAEKAGALLSSTLSKAFDGLVVKGKSFNDVLKSVALSLSQTVLKQAFAPLEKGIGSLFTSALSGIGFAKGGAFQNGSPTPFAKGGVLASPMTFPMSGGATGLAGESGAEAILPLARGSDGRLGVASSGGGGGPQITINISTPDAESFRRSESQVAAMISRAAAMGQRNL